MAFHNVFLSALSVSKKIDVIEKNEELPRSVLPRRRIQHVRRCVSGLVLCEKTLLLSALSEEVRRLRYRFVVA